MKKIIIVIIIIIILGIGYWALMKETLNDQADEKINSFEDCVKAGFPVMESYPRQCKDSEEKLFVEDIGNELEKMDLIRVSNPRPNQVITSPFVVEGEARGYWFFEADFPIQLLDENDNLIAEAIARAQGEWMTEDFVLFEAELNFEKPSGDRGKIIFKRDNPSDLRGNDDELVMPIYFGE